MLVLLVFHQCCSESFKLFINERTKRLIHLLLKVLIEDVKISSHTYVKKNSVYRKYIGTFPESQVELGQKKARCRQPNAMLGLDNSEYDKVQYEVPTPGHGANIPI